MSFSVNLSLFHGYVIDGPILRLEVELIQAHSAFKAESAHILLPLHVSLISIKATAPISLFTVCGGGQLVNTLS
jgi:hypothetical protein